MKTISQLVQDRAADSRDRVFLRFNDVDTTYGDLHAGVQRTAGALLAAGVRRGDRVGLMLNSSLDHIELFLATAWIGAVVVPFSVHFRAAGRQAPEQRPDAQAARRARIVKARRVDPAAAHPVERRARTGAGDPQGRAGMSDGEKESTPAMSRRL